MNAKAAQQPLQPILLVDDDDLDVISVERQLARMSIENPIIRKKNGVDAINFLHDEGENIKLSVILLDINMPKKNGLEFLQELRRDFPELGCRVYIFTTSESETEQEAAKSFQVSGFIFKQEIKEGLKSVIFND